MMAENIKEKRIEKVPQQWEMLASPGHTLFAQVDAYQKKLKPAVIAASVAAAIFYAVIASTSTLGSVSRSVGYAAGWLVYKFDNRSVPSLPVENLAPKFSSLERTANPPNFYALITQESQPTPADQVRANMASLKAAVTAGTKIDACMPGQKLTEPWAAQGDLSARCKYSADGNRLWVWMLASSNNRPGWFVGLVRKNGTDVVVYNVRESGLLTIGGLTPLDAASIPRAIALDFPELESSPGVRK